MDKPPVAPLAIVLSFWVVFAAICVIWPKSVQALSTRSASRWPAWYLKYYPFARWTKEWMNTPAYVSYLRVMGILMIFLGGIMMIVFFRAH